MATTVVVASPEAVGSPDAKSETIESLCRVVASAATGVVLSALASAATRVVLFAVASAAIGTVARRRLRHKNEQCSTPFRDSHRDTRLQKFPSHALSP